ncbi:MAG: SDR family oxidoreductase, partial [Eubacterium sp.]
GIGLACVRKLAENGAIVYIGGIFDHYAEEALAAFKEDGLTVKFIPFNANDYDSYEAMIDTIVAEEKRFDILVNNFGMGSPGKDLDLVDGDPYVFFDVLHKNIGSVYIPCKVAVKYMIEHGGGNIVNISSIGGNLPDLSRLGYGVSKNAISYLTKNIAVQYARQGVRCNAVAPGMIGTNAVKDNMTPEFQAAFLKHVPLGRMGTPEDIANAVLFFASDESSFITGTIQEVAGGYGIPAPEYADGVDG